MKKFILAEKPSVARDLAAVLGSFQKKDGYLENDEYIVSWAIGHLVGLAEPEDYDVQLKKWTLDALPIMPANFKLKTNPKTIKQFKIVKQLVNRSDVGQLVCATDAGREGELIFRYIYRLTGCKKPFMRLWLSETTPAAVQRGFAELKPGEQFNNLAAAAEARSQADWLIGINATRSFTVKHNTLLSIGRVQTPTLALIVNREREIKNFVPEPYWELYAEFTKSNGQAYTGRWFNGEQNRFHALQAAQAVQARVNNQPAHVLEVEEKEVAELPPLLFNLNDLQKEANKKYGLAAARTLELAQSLYETRKLLTYPRTDSRHLTRELAKTIPGRLSALASVTEYEPYNNVTAKAANTLGKRYVDDGKVSDHTALIPTDIKPVLSNLPPDERKIYDLVARRFLAIFFPPARYKQTKVITETAGETFLTTGRVELDKGWKTVYESVKNDPDEGEDSGVIPELARGETVQTTKTEIREKETKPPKRYTEASLLAVMEGAGRLVEDRELKAAMKGHGLGTPATRAAIIERLLKVGYIERHKKTLVPTTKGETLIDLVPEIIKNPELTGQWEKTLADIEAGTAKPGEFMNGIKQLTGEIVELARSQAASNQVQTRREALGNCPLCGKAVIEGKKGYGCSGYKEGCKFIIWKEIAGKSITQSQAKTLLKKGKTGIIKGFTSKAGKKFEAALQINNGKVEFLFIENNSGKKVSLGQCPICGKEVTETSKSYSCSGYKEGCKFVIRKEIAGKRISVQQAQKLLTSGKTALIKGFKSKAGKSFNAFLALGQDGKVEFQFTVKV
ncbi:DNA topoisomerase III [Desulfoscipio gibsoniae]|uniref:DNA topoisomerase n=1 Tax=Desulfoscipio gibsoniae DSM 7213 TaxID=767817 RepID=R4KKI7_9FIRM|nr:DNA topoisomerase III [Desulfoscipio gibsoniae]AGL03174.1 DNA topoisomerase III [Desulfoscipio gibsoniae DSM 7213]